MKRILPTYRSLLSLPLFFALVLSLFSGCAAGKARPLTAQVPVAATSQAETDASPASDDRLYSLLWMKIAPEYRALCLQAFQAALSEVREQVRNAPRVEGVPVGPRGLPLAVVSDLDETLLDNWGYQDQLVASGTDYTSETWAEWVRGVTGVGLIPGAAGFVRKAEELGVTMVYISNRPDSLRQYTIETLQRLGIASGGLAEPEQRRLLLRTDASDKRSRRQAALEVFDVMLYLGDNLGDFPDFPAEDPGTHDAAVERLGELWGTRWIVLPNPIYGDWTRPFRGKNPRQYLDEIRQ